MLIFGVIGTIVLCVFLVVVLKMRKIEHRNVLFGGREFEIYLSPELSGKMCGVNIYEVVRPNRKFFRTKYRCYKTFWLSDFETIKQGMYAMIDSYLINETEENLINEKWEGDKNG